jgi:V/A-type H+/Na+-transporting ATPase subunit E
MSNSIEDKISLFTKVIIERIELDCKQKEKKVADYFENRKAKIINEQEEQKSNSVEKATKGAESKKQRLILKTQSDLHLAVLKKKREFTERLTAEVEKRIRDFISTKEYEDFLRKAIKEVLSKIAGKQFVILKFSENDIKHRQNMILETINADRDTKTYKIETDENLVGGIFAKTGDRRLEIDFTINTILEESDKLIGEVLSSRLNKE